MPLPPAVLRQFRKIPANPTEAEFHGPYNKILTICFPPDSRYTVIPRYWPGSPHQSADLIFRFEVVLDAPDRTIFVLELEPPSDLGLVSRREIADLQIRQHLRDVNRPCRLPGLAGNSGCSTISPSLYRLPSSDPPRRQRDGNQARVLQQARQRTRDPS